MGCIEKLFCPRKNREKNYESISENNSSQSYRKNTKLTGLNEKQSKNEFNLLFLKKCKQFIKLFPKLKLETEIEYLNENYKLFENDMYIIELCIKEGISTNYNFVFEGKCFKAYDKIQKVISKFEKILSLELESEVMKFTEKLKNSKISGKLNVAYKEDSLIFKFGIKDEEYNSNNSTNITIELIIKLKREKEFKKMRKIYFKKDNFKLEIIVFLLLLIILIIIVEENGQNEEENKVFIMIDKADEIFSEKNEKETINNFYYYGKEMQNYHYEIQN